MSVSEKLKFKKVSTNFFFVKKAAKIWQILLNFFIFQNEFIFWEPLESGKKIFPKEQYLYHNLIFISGKNLIHLFVGQRKYFI
jgi:hypothetical protein